MRVPRIHTPRRAGSSARRAAALLAVVLLLLALAAPAPMAAQQANPNLDEPFGRTTSIVDLANALFKFGVVLCVLAASIYIAIGAFMYFAASGNAALAQRGKEYVTRSIIGLILALISWVILTTIHPQFTKRLEDPKFQNAGQR